MAHSPFGPDRNLSTLQTEIAPRWVADSDDRGTWTLLYSCVFTLVLCVWTAVHLNVPAAGETERGQFLRKVKYVVLAIFAPETTVFTAWQQWFEARQFCNRINEAMIQSRDASEEEPKLPSQQRPHPGGGNENSLHDHIFDKLRSKASTTGKKSRSPTSVSLTYGFYVVMGGFAVDVSDMHDKISQLTLTPTGVLELAKLGLFTELSDSEIRDKSKADWLAKSLVILQVSWMMLQCISRKMAGYPLAPLEVHTLVHAACAAVMYFIWFKKPLEVKRPTVINTAGFEEPLALMLLQSPRIGWVQNDDISIPGGLMRFRMDGNFYIFRLWPNKMVSEASYLLYLKKGQSGEQQVTIDDPANDNEDTTKQVVTPKNHSSLQIHPRSALKLTPVSTSRGAASSQPPSSTRSPDELEEQMELTSAPPSKVPIVVTLDSGDTLAQGIGPNGFPLQHLDKPGRSVVRFKEQLFKRRRVTARSNIALLDSELSGELPRDHISGFRNKTFYKLSMSLSAKDVLRWNRAGAHLSQSNAFNGTPGKLDRLLSIKNSDLPDTNHVYDYLTLRSENFSTAAFSRLMDDDVNFHTDARAFLMLLLLILLGLLYGGVHLSLWKHEFASRAEALLWKISCVTLLGVPVGFTTWLLVLDVAVRAVENREEPPDSTWEKLNLGTGNKQLSRASRLLPALKKSFYYIVAQAVEICRWVNVLAIVVAAPLYLFARIYIVVESFLSLRHVPVGVYVQADWAKYIPHL